MPLTGIEIRQFRCIEQAQLQLDPRCNVIFGPNGSGKTSVLEACFLLGSGHSFRTRQSAPLIRHSSEEFLILGRISNRLGIETIGVRGLPDAREFKISGTVVRSAAELAVHFPIQAIEPEVHRLIEDGPNRRRQFLDWGVFHVEPQFHQAWKRYSRALRQRNAALKQSSKDTELWEEELVEQGMCIAQFRDRYIATLEPFITLVSQRLLNVEVHVRHAKGWHQELNLETALTAARARDLKLRTTTVGPHRADLRVELNGEAAREHVSRGQQKLLACVLLLAQQMHYVSLGMPPGCLLLDDPGAELDVDNLWKLLEIVSTIQAQLIITTLSEHMRSHLPAHHLFHVEHGHVQQVA